MGANWGGDALPDATNTVLTFGSATPATVTINLDNNVPPYLWFPHTLNFSGGTTWTVDGAGTLSMMPSPDGPFDQAPQLMVWSGTVVQFKAGFDAYSTDTSFGNLLPWTPNNAGGDTPFWGGFWKVGEGELQMLGTSTLSNNPAAPGRIYVAEGTLSFNGAAALGGSDNAAGTTGVADTEIMLAQDPGFYDAAYPPVTLKYLGKTAGADHVTLTGLRTLRQGAQTFLNVVEAQDTLTLAGAIGNSMLTSATNADPTLVKQGPGTLELKPMNAAGVPVANTFGGNVRVSEGTLVIHHTNALGTPGAVAGDLLNGRLFLESGTTLRVLNPYVSSTDPTPIPTNIDPGGGADGGNGRFRVFNIAGNATLDVQAFSLQINDGPLYATEYQLQGTGTLTKKGPGKLLLGNPTDSFDASPAWSGPSRCS